MNFNFNSKRFFTDTLEIIGVFNFNRFKQWRKYQRVLMCINYTFMFIFLVFHLYSTITRATKYVPELMQQLLEDIMNVNIIFYPTLYITIKTKTLDRILTFMETEFCPLKGKILRQSRKRIILLFMTCFFSIGMSIVSCMMEAVLPLSPEEVAIHRYVYPAKRPERMLQWVIKVPFINETDSPYYEIIFLWELYLGALFVPIATFFVTFIPINISHIAGQYDVLCTHVKNFGRILRDDQGRRIYYTNIEKNQVGYYRAPSEMTISGRDRYIVQMMFENTYEEVHLRQIIQFHQKLLKFQQNVSTLLIDNFL